MSRLKGSKNKKKETKMLTNTEEMEERFGDHSIVEPVKQAQLCSSTCQNPFKRGEHKTEKGENPHDIWLFIQHKGETIPICKSCWLKLGESEDEWGDSLKPDFSKRELTKEELED